jgi:sigma-B regulation protein RsbU (phosphoserine phosphatase)
MQRQDALALASAIRAAAGSRDPARMAAVYAEDAVAVSPVFGEVHGRDAIVANWKTLWATFPDLALETSDLLVDGDRIAILGAVKSVDRVGWFGLPPTGSVIDYRIVLILTVRDGRIVRDERIYDSAAVIAGLEKARIDKELKTAAVVQQGLLSRTERVGPFYQSVGDSVPCRAIGGDFFDLLELPSGDVGLVMGDVAGKGPAAALLASMLLGMFTVEAPAGDGPGVTLARLNHRLAARRIEARFATLVYGVLSSGGQLTYANAGHNAPALLTDRGIRRLDVGGPILGAFDTATFEEETVSLRQRDTIVMFTDGVTEATNSDEEEFGEPRLIDCLSRSSDAAPPVLLRRIFDSVHHFSEHAEQHDDITVTVTRFG